MTGPAQTSIDAAQRASRLAAALYVTYAVADSVAAAITPPADNRAVALAAAALIVDLGIARGIARQYRAVVIFAGLLVLFRTVMFLSTASSAWEISALVIIYAVAWSSILTGARGAFAGNRIEVAGFEGVQPDFLTGQIEGHNHHPGTKKPGRVVQVVGERGMLSRKTVIRYCQER